MHTTAAFAASSLAAPAPSASVPSSLFDRPLHLPQPPQNYLHSTHSASSPTTSTLAATRVAPSTSSLLNPNNSGYSAADLQRHYELSLTQLSAAYDHRLAHLASTLSHTLLTLAADETLQALRRDEAMQPTTLADHAAKRIDELLRSAVNDEREGVLRHAYSELANARTRIVELETTQNNSTISSSNGADSSQQQHSRSPTQTQHIQQLESQLRNVQHDLDIIRQSETVYRSQITQLESYIFTQQSKLDATQRQLTDTEVAQKCTNEQLALTLEHVKEAELRESHTEKRIRAKMATRIQESQNEIERLRNENSTLQQQNLKLQADSAEQLHARLAELKVDTTQDYLIQLNKHQYEAQKREKELDQSWRSRLQEVEARMHEVEKGLQEEIRTLRAKYQEERETSDATHQRHIDQLNQGFAQQAHDIKQAHALELEQSRERIEQLLTLQSQLKGEKEQIGYDLTRAQTLQNDLVEKRVNEVRQSQHAMQEQINTLKHELAMMTSQKEQLEKRLTESSAECRRLLTRHDEMAEKYHTLNSSSSHSTQEVHKLTQERDLLKSKYLALGEKMESICTNIETNLTLNQEQEQAKRELMKQQYAEERSKWKQEKQALMETVSLQERKMLELQNINSAAEEKIESMQQFTTTLQKDIEASRASILSLEQRCAKHDHELASKVFHIEKLEMHHKHQEEYKATNLHQLQLEKDRAVASLECEYNLKHEQLLHDLEQAKKEMANTIEKLKTDHQLEKGEMEKDASGKIAAAVDQLKSTMFTAEQLEFQVKLRTEERVSTINASLLHPHQHESIVQSKLDMQRSKLHAEYEVIMHEMNKKHADKLNEVEERHQAKIEESHVRFEQEYRLYTEKMRLLQSDAEVRVRQEKETHAQLLQQESKLGADFRTLQSTIHQLESKCEQYQLNEQRFLSHIGSQSSVIEKLKSMLDIEKTRVNGLPQLERDSYLKQIDEMNAKYIEEREYLLANHHAQVVSLQELLTDEKNAIKSLMVQRGLLENQHRLREEQLMEQQRQTIDSLQVRTAEHVAALEKQHESVWSQREMNWQQEYKSRESEWHRKFREYSTSYKEEIATREQRIQTLTQEIKTIREKSLTLEDELSHLRKQLHDTVSVLEQQTHKMTRASALTQSQQRNGIA